MGFACERRAACGEILKVFFVEFAIYQQPNTMN